MAKKKFFLYLLLLDFTITRIGSEFLHEMPADIQEFAAKKHLQNDGFTSFHISLPLQKSKTGLLSPFHSHQLKSNGDPEVLLHVPFEKETFVLKLRTSFSVLHPETSISFANGNKEDLVTSRPYNNCYLSGYLVSHDGVASFSHCNGNGLEGAMTADESEFAVHVLPLNLAHRHKRSAAEQPYLVAKRSMNYSLGFRNQKTLGKELAKEIKTRVKRDAKNVTNLIVEIAVYTDSGLTQALEMDNSMFSLQRKIDFIVTKYNGVQYEFWKYDELGGFNITIQLKKIVFFTKDPMTKYRDDTMDAVLEAFCAWQQPRLPFDHVMLLSSKVVDKPGGRAYRPGVCKPEFRCAISTIVKWGFWYIETHELGHNLGMDHNDNTECRADPTEKQGLMGKRRTGWSPCSTKAFKDLVNSNGAQCLFEENIRPEMVDPNTFGIVLNGFLPGMYLTPDESCRARHGPGYRYRSYPNLGPCMYHSCTYMMDGPAFGTMKVHRYGLAGLYCGPHKICLLSLKCVDIDSLNFKASVIVQSGGWGSWGPWSECIPSCGKGIRYRERFCTNPKPLNSPDCVGHRFMSIPCEKKDCDASAMDSVTKVQKIINELCQSFLKQGKISKKYIEEGELFGTDEFSVCEFSCFPRSSSSYDRFDRFGLLPDGTPCKVFSKVPDPTKHKSRSLCVKGSCQYVGCDSNIAGKFFDVCGVCGGDASTCRRVNGVKELIPHQDIVSEFLEIPAFASNIVIKFNFTNEEEAFLMLWSKDEVAVLDPSLNLTRTLRNPIQFGNASWDYDSQWFLVSPGPIDQPVKVKVMIGANITARSLIFNYSLPLLSEQKNCPIKCFNNGLLSNCSCKCYNNTGGRDCRTCSIVCLNGGEVDENSCKCKCPSSRMMPPRCECQDKYRGKNCSQCRFIRCGPCGKYDWEKCQCFCQPGFGGKNCQRLCKDHLSSNECLQRAINQECTTNFPFMKENCEATCQLCRSSVNSSDTCDLNVSIRSLQKDGPSMEMKETIFFEDVQNAMTKKNQCSKLELPCDKTRCIPFNLLCDGYQNCQDGLDENKKACEALKIAGCPNNHNQFFVIFLSLLLSSIGKFY